jgi:dephospho-CoA kinase
MMVVGITGGIGSGKSTACQIFRVLGIPIYDADSRAKWLMEHDPPLQASIKNLLSEQAFDSDGRLNNAYIAELVFKNPALLAKLNALVHPAVAVDTSKWLEAQTSPYVLKEAALLFESGASRNMDAVIVVHADEQIRIERVMLRNKITEEQVKDRIKRQMPETEKLRLADYVILNDGSQSLIRQVLSLHQTLLDRSKTF